MTDPLASLRSPAVRPAYILRLVSLGPLNHLVCPVLAGPPKHPICPSSLPTLTQDCYLSFPSYWACYRSRQFIIDCESQNNCQRRYCVFSRVWVIVQQSMLPSHVESGLGRLLDTAWLPTVRCVPILAFLSSPPWCGSWIRVHVWSRYVKSWHCQVMTLSSHDTSVMSCQVMTLPVMYSTCHDTVCHVMSGHDTVRHILCLSWHCLSCNVRSWHCMSCTLPVMTLSIMSCQVMTLPVMYFAYQDITHGSWLTVVSRNVVKVSWVCDSSRVVSRWVLTPIVISHHVMSGHNPWIIIHSCVT